MPCYQNEASDRYCSGTRSYLFMFNLKSPLVQFKDIVKDKSIRKFSCFFLQNLVSSLRIDFFVYFIESPKRRGESVLVMLQIQQIKMQPTSRTVAFLTSHLTFYNYNFTVIQAGQQSKRMISALENIVYILNIEQDTVLKMA